MWRVKTEQITRSSETIGHDMERILPLDLHSAMGESYDISERVHMKLRSLCLDQVSPLISHVLLRQTKGTCGESDSAKERELVVAYTKPMLT